MKTLINMEKNKTLFDAWVASWKLHIFFYPIYTWMLIDMLPNLYDPNNENPMLVKVLVTVGVIVLGIFGLGRFVYLWSKQK